MTPEEAKEGTAKVVYTTGIGWQVLFGDSELAAYHDMSKLEADHFCNKINRALTPLLLRAELAGRLADALKALHDRYAGLVESGDAGNWDCHKEPVMIKSREALKSWDAIKGDGDA